MAQTNVNGIRLVINDLDISVTQVSEKWNCQVIFELIYSVLVFDSKTRQGYNIVEMMHEYNYEIPLLKASIKITKNYLIGDLIVA